MSQPGFRSFSPALKRFFIATVINMIGSSMLFAFVFIYLDEVRGFSSSRAGLAVGMTPIAMVLTTPLAGFLSDRFGPRRVLTIGCLLSIVAGCAYIWVSHCWPPPAANNSPSRARLACYRSRDRSASVRASYSAACKGPRSRERRFQRRATSGGARRGASGAADERCLCGGPVDHR